MPTAVELSYMDMHTAGEPVRIVTGGYPELRGRTVLEQRRDARERFDHRRRAMMLEPRGHAGMYGVIPVRPSHPGAGWACCSRTMRATRPCAATPPSRSAAGWWTRGLVPMVEPETRFVIEAPVRPLALACTVRDGAVTRCASRAFRPTRMRWT